MSTPTATAPTAPTAPIAPVAMIPQHSPSTYQKEKEAASRKRKEISSKETSSSKDVPAPNRQSPPVLPVPEVKQVSHSKSINSVLLIETFEQQMDDMKAKCLELLRAAIRNAENIETVAKQREQQTRALVKKLKADVLSALDQEG